MPPTPSPVTPAAATSGALDPRIVNLAKAIRQVESSNNFTQAGKSGEYGAYQFMPDTWAGASQKFLGQSVPLNQATPQQQNEVAYKQLSEWAQQHPDWNVGNFASAWNAGPGKPNAYQEGYTGVNSKGVSYDTPAYATQVAQAYQQFKAQSATSNVPSDLTPTPQAPENPSLGGFAGNVVKSGANLLGGIGEAILHPIQTVQNVGGAAVGGLEKLGGQTNDNTQKFDNLINFFKDRYGSVDQLEKTLYNDPVGVAADLSTLLGGAGLAAKGAGLAANVGKAGEIAGALDTAGNVLGKASEVTNPLTPIAKGVGAAVKPVTEFASGSIGKLSGIEPSTVDAIRANPSAFTPEQIANTTRDAVSAEVENAFKTKLKSFEQTGKDYNPIREIAQPGKSFSAESLVPVDKNFLEDQLRSVAGVDVKDGQIVANGSSVVRNATELGKLQKTLELWQPAFKKGSLTPNEYLNFRQDLREAAYNDLGKKSTTVARVTDQIAHNLNEKYRGGIPGLEALDLKFSKQLEEVKNLRKGLFDKTGKLNENATNLIANAGNKGNEARLARLEQIHPGITEKLKVLKAIEDIRKAMGTKAGTYGRSILEAGGTIGGLATGQISVIALGLASGILTNPSNAVALIRAAAKIDPRIVSEVMARLARYATIGSVVAKGESQATGSPDLQSQPESPVTPPSSPTSTGTGTNQESVSQNPQSTQSLEDLAKAHNFDLESARKEGYTDAEIASYLSSKETGS